MIEAMNTAISNPVDVVRMPLTARSRRRAPPSTVSRFLDD
jgi:hypothetical protein